jgi:hypothetical protein
MQKRNCGRRYRALFVPSSTEGTPSVYFFPQQSNTLPKVPEPVRGPVLGTAIDHPLSYLRRATIGGLDRTGGPSVHRIRIADFWANATFVSDERQTLRPPSRREVQHAARRGRRRCVRRFGR